MGKEKWVRYGFKDGILINFSFLINILLSISYNDFSIPFPSVTTQLTPFSENLFAFGWIEPRFMETPCWHLFWGGVGERRCSHRPTSLSSNFIISRATRNLICWGLKGLRDAGLSLVKNGKTSWQTGIVGHPNHSSILRCQVSKRDNTDCWRLGSVASQQLGVLSSALYFTEHFHTPSHFNLIKN